MTRFEGRARRLGDHVNTDYIIASRRKRDTLDESRLTRYIFEAIDPAFADSVRPGDILVAGRNFGCGSAMEIAATVLVAAGFRVVAAESFARAFFRNAVNNGLTPVVVPTTGFQEGDRVVIEAGDAAVTMHNCRSGIDVSGPPLPATMAAILAAGGLVPYVRTHGRLPGIPGA
jgi:3-isopropylmalate/(R)-2-methylmalate dehydratase small subunit